jgi:hypothetical protein
MQSRYGGHLRCGLRPRRVLRGNQELSARHRRTQGLVEQSGNPRHARVTETLRRAFYFDNKQAKNLRRMVATYFRFRGWAVHPPADYRTPQLHDLLRVGVEWRFAAFSAPNAREAVLGVTHAIAHGLRVPRSHGREFVEWCERVLPEADARRRRCAEKLGPPFPDPPAS